jgi:hypothetical protein
MKWNMTVISATQKVEMKGSWFKALCQRTSEVWWWCVPVIPATGEVEVEDCGQRLIWAKV